jgi:hypothetical protein
VVRILVYDTVRLTSLFLLCAATLAADVFVEQAPRDDLALQMAVSELRLTLKTSGGRVTLRGPAQFGAGQAAADQGFEILPENGGLVVRSSGTGLVHGAFRLAELVHRDGFNPGLRLAERPAFAERMFSYEGTVLDLPDEGYYFRDRPYANPFTIEAQSEAARAAMRHLLRYGFNSITFLHLNLEDYVNYDRLGDGFRVYAADSLHRARSEQFCRMLRDLTGYAHRLHMRLYIQIYEFSFPDHLDGRTLTDASEYTWRVAEARLTEMLQRTGVDGLVVTATEPSPRLNYRGFQLWKTPEGAGRMAQRYQQIIVGKNKRRMIFRTWWVADDMASFNRVLSTAPDAGTVYDAKEGDGDFFLCVGENRLLHGGAPARRPFMITFDAFRQFDGWGRALFFPSFWGERFRSSQRQGVKIVNAWGPWIPGCIYPGTWVAKYDDYDYLRQEHSPAHAMLYLFARLAWDPRQPVARIAGDWARLYFGQHAGAVEEALLLSNELWKTTYLGSSPNSGLAFKWTMLFQRRPELIDRAGVDWSIKTVRESNRRAIELADRIHALLYSIDPAVVPSPGMARELQRSADLTALYFRTFTLWRELVFLDHRAAGERAAILAVASDLEKILPEWRRFPREAKDWLVFQFDPDLATAPGWMQRSSLAEAVEEMKLRALRIAPK